MRPAASAARLLECATHPARIQQRSQPGWVERDQPEHAPWSLNVFAYDPQRQVVAGLFGEIQFSWVKVSIMAVRDDLRGQGIGTHLMQIAEAEAVRRGCRYAYVDTMNYQVPEF